MSVFFYISGHGFGHAVRQIEVINALRTLAPDLRVVVRTSAPGWLFERSLTRPVAIRHSEVDAAVVQIDALRIDEPATIRGAERFHRELPGKARVEAGILEVEGARLVVSDAPPLACAAAQALGIPAVVCANFTWDWIYGAYADAAAGVPALVEAVRDAYGPTAVGWRLPMHGGFESLREVIDVPFVARHPAPGRTPEDTRRALGLPDGRPLALVSFGGVGLEDLPLHTLDCTAWGVVIVGPHGRRGGAGGGVYVVPEDRMSARGLRYADVVHAVDVVLTKPGYGIVSDCLASGTAMLYTPRGRFPEYDVLVREMPRFLRCRRLETEDFLAGRWEAGFDAVADQPAPLERPRADGATRVAGMIVETLG